MYLQVVCLSLRTNCKYPQFCLHTVESYFQDLQRVGEVAETKIGFRHSGFTFSHYELPFPTRDCNPWAAVTSALYQPVIRVKVIRVCVLHCIRAVTSFSHCIRSLVRRCGHHDLGGRVSGIASARITLTVSTVVPSYSYFCCC